MTDVLDDSLRVWKADPADESKWKDTDGTVATHAYRPPSEDSLVLFDAGTSKGVSHAVVLWLWRGKGGWLLNATDAVRKFDCEPAAGAFLQSLLDELARVKPGRLNRRLVLANPDAPLAKFLVENNFAAGTKVKGKAKESVLLIDADGKPLSEKTLARIQKLCAAGGTAAIFNMTQETNTAVLDLFKIGWKKWESPQVEIPWGARGRFVKNDNGPKFVTRRDNKSVMKGIPNDWFFWWDVSMMWCWARDYVMGSDYTVGMFKDVKMVMNGIIEPRDGFNGKILTDPSAMALVRVGKGAVLFSTLKMNENLDKNGAKIARIVRALLNNMNVATTRKAYENASWLPVDFRKGMTHGLWDNPAYKDEKGRIKPPSPFFGERDLRYFPVNNCGWSLLANNYCPVEPFPEEPLLFNDVPFKIQNPETNDRRATIRLTDRNPLHVDLPPKTRIKRIHFLGGCQWGCKGVDLSFGRMTKKGLKVEPVIRFTGEHIGDVNGPNPKVPKGKLAWVGKGGEKPNPLALYTWAAENPDPKTPVASFSLTVPESNSGAVIVAITIELADAAGK